MSKRLLTALASGLLVAAAGLFAVPSQAAPTDPVVVAVIDTGINPHHPEFDYGGPGDPDDQIVGWWDFSDDAEGHYPGPGQLWDPVFPEPYDVHGHGTATASMAVGHNRSDEKAPAAFPGGKLAMAKVGSGPRGSVISGDLSAAFEWATETVGADVISMSIGSGFVLLSNQWLYDAIASARDAGVLVVVSNGNGFLNAAIPGEPGMLKGYGDSPDVLAVGAAGASGLLVTTDPEVVADFSPTAAHKGGGYARATGTSFSAPFVAGFAGRLIHEARSAGQPIDVSRLEDLLKFSSRDTALPPNVEGYGVLDIDQLGPAIGHARAGTVPEPDALNHAYSTLVRDTVTELLRG